MLGPLGPTCRRHLPSLNNVYTYIGGNPISLVDPFGEDARVKVDGSNVEIIIPITYSGNAATPLLIASLNQSISNQWSGQFGKFTVTTTVVTGSENTVNLVSGAGTSVVANGNADLVLAHL